MDSYNNYEQDFAKKEQEIKAREAEIRLRELELEIHQQSQQNNANVPHYQTRKHEDAPNSFKKLTRKLVKVAKFLGFTILTLALMRLSFLIGMWLAYGMITVVIIFVGYQIFMANNDD